MPLNLKDLDRLLKNDPKLVTLDLSKQSLDADDLDLLSTNLKHNTHLGRIKWPDYLPNDPISQQYWQTIQKRLDKNNKDFTAHPSHYQHAVLSSHVYKPHVIGQVVTLEEPQYNMAHKLLGWTVAKIFDLNRDNGLYAVLYVNSSAGHCVLAFRGTEPIPPEFTSPITEPAIPSATENPGYQERIKRWFNEVIHKTAAMTEQVHAGSRDLLTDLNLIAGRITAQQIDAYQLALKTAAYADEHGYRLSFTGHSLGGWLAQLMAIHLLWDCRLDPNSPLRPTCAQLRVITFDNPGIDAMVAAIQPTIEVSRQIWQETLDAFAKITTAYLTVPNPVNTAGKQYGKVYRLLAEVPDLNALILESFFQWGTAPQRLKTWADSLGMDFDTASRWGIDQAITALGIQTGLSHSMQYLLKAFDPATGEARQSKQVIDWPTVDWTASKNPVHQWIKDARSKPRTWIAKKTAMPEFLLEYLLEYGEDFILTQLSGLVLNLFELPKEFKKLPGELAEIPGLAYLWCSGKVNNAALREFLSFAQQLGKFDISQSEVLMIPKQSYYLQFKHHYRADTINPLRRPLQDFSKQEKELLDIWDDFNHYSQQTSLISGSFFEEPLFQELQQQFAIVVSRVVANEEYLDVEVKQVTLCQFENQLFRLLQLYKTDVAKDWTSYWKNHNQKGGQNEAIHHKNSFEIREQVWWDYHRAVYREGDFLTSLFTDGQQQPIETAYVNLMLLQEEHQQQIKLEDKNKAAPLDSREKHLSSFEDIYASKTPLQTNELFTQVTQKRYLIMGRAGIGKSTLLHYLTYQWSHTAWGKQFEWVFWIKLRNLNSQRYSSNSVEWVDILSKECFDDTLNPAEKQHLKNLITPLIAQGKVLWLLDGYDEIASKLNQPAYAALKPAIEQLVAMPWLILTSRPEAMMQDRSFDQRLEIAGFTNTDIQGYITRYFAHNADNGQKLLNFLKDNPSVWGIAHIPINLQLLCHIWQTQTLEADINLTQLYQSLVNRLLKRYAQKQNFQLLENQSDLMVHPKLESSVQQLAEMAFQGMERGQVVMSLPTIKLKPLLEIGLIRIIDQTNPSITNIEFIHLTFQEFFAGFYLEQLIIKEDVRIVSLIAQYKYNPHFEISWWFVSGLLVSQPARLQLFFNYLLSEPRDLTSFYEYGLLMRCLDESAAAEFLGKATLWKDLQVFWRRMLFQTNNVHQPLIDRLAFSPVFAKELVDLIVQAFESNDFFVNALAMKAVPTLLQVAPVLADQLFPSLLEKFDDKHAWAKEAMLDTNAWAREALLEAMLSVLQTQPVLTERMLQELLEKLNDKDSSAKITALKIIPSILRAKPSEINIIFSKFLEELNDKDDQVKIAALKIVPTIIQTKPILTNQLLPMLFELAADGNGAVSTLALDAVKEILRWFMPFMPVIDTDKKREVREAALEAISVILRIQPALIDQVLPALFDELDSNWIDTAVKVMGATAFLAKASQSYLPVKVYRTLFLSGMSGAIFLMWIKSQNWWEKNPIATIKIISILLQIRPELTDQLLPFLIEKSNDQSASVIAAAREAILTLLQTNHLASQKLSELLNVLISKGIREHDAVKIILSLVKESFAGKPLVNQSDILKLIEKCDNENEYVKISALKMLPIFIGSNPALANQVPLTLFKKLDDKNFKVRVVVLEIAVTLLQTIPESVVYVLPMLLDYLNKQQNDTALFNFPVTCYIYQRTVYFYLDKVGYSVVVSPQQEAIFLQNIIRSRPAWLSPMLRPTVFDANHKEIDEIPTCLQEQEVNKFTYPPQSSSIADKGPIAAETDPSLLQTSSASSHYDNNWLPITLVASLGQHLCGYWQPTLVPSNSNGHRVEELDEPVLVLEYAKAITEPATSEAKASHFPEITLHCMSSEGRDQQPVTVCVAGDYTVYVFPKAATETTAVSFNGQTVPSTNADRYNPQSCRPVEFYGRPLVFCEGEQTNLLYTPTLPAPLFADLDGNIMLGRVVWHWAGSTYTWVKQSISDWRHPTPSSLTNAPLSTADDKITGLALQTRCQELDMQLSELEYQLGELPAVQQRALQGLQFALNEYRDLLQEIQNQGNATFELLSELTEAIAISQEEIYGELHQREFSSVPINPAQVSASFFAMPTPPVVINHRQAMERSAMLPLDFIEPTPIKTLT